MVAIIKLKNIFTSATDELKSLILISKGIIIV
jgi:hypothetical protein